MGGRVHDEQAKAIRTIEAELQRAIQAGQADIAWRLWERLLAQAPDHPDALMALGQQAFRGGDLARARSLLQHLVGTDGRHKQQWIKLAVVCAAQQDEAGEAQAISGALRLDPHDLLGLILRADLLTRQGKVHEAARAPKGRSPRSRRRSTGWRPNCGRRSNARWRRARATTPSWPAISMPSSSRTCADAQGERWAAFASRSTSCSGASSASTRSRRCFTITAWRRRVFLRAKRFRGSTPSKRPLAPSTTNSPTCSAATTASVPT